MSSVLIKGMEMPDKCGRCRLFHAEYPMHCTAIKEYRTASAPYGMPKPDWCPLVEMPTPHGRLIDADELAFNLNGMMEVSPTGYIHGDTVADMIGDAPTIIEAEGEQ